MKALINVALVVFVVLVVYDIFWQERPRELRFTAPQPTSAQLDSRLQITSVTYDLQSHSVKGTMSLFVEAKDDRNIDNVAFSPSDSGWREWLTAGSKQAKREDAGETAGNCQLQLSEELEKGKSIASATLECKDIALAKGAGTEEIWYPFDTYHVAIAPSACINSIDGSCGKLSQAQAASLTSVGVSIGDQNLVGDLTKDSSSPDSYVLTLRRRFLSGW